MQEVRISRAPEGHLRRISCARPAPKAKGDYTLSREKEGYIEIIRFRVDQSLAVACTLLSISCNIVSAEGVVISTFFRTEEMKYLPKSLGLSCGI